MDSAALERSRSETGDRASWRARRFLRGWLREARIRTQVLPAAADASGLRWTISFAVSFRRRTQFGPYHLSQEGTTPRSPLRSGEAGSRGLENSLPAERTTGQWRAPGS